MPRPLPPSVLASTAGDANAVRDHILDAAHRVIARDGLAAASTRAIAEEAGLGVGTLYNYFDDRLQLLAGAILRRTEVLSRPLSHLPSMAGSGEVASNLRISAERIEEVLDDLVPLVAAAFANVDLLDALRHETSQGHDTGPFRIDPIERYLNAERELGRIAADADCRSAASLVMSLCHDSAFGRFFHGQGARRKSITGELDLIAHAVTSPHG